MLTDQPRLLLAEAGRGIVDLPFGSAGLALLWSSRHSAVDRIVSASCSIHDVPSCAWRGPALRDSVMASAPALRDSGAPRAARFWRCLATRQHGARASRKGRTSGLLARKVSKYVSK